MFDFNNVNLIDDNNLNGVEREFLINSFLTYENLPKIFKLLYSTDIEISPNSIYFPKDYNNYKPMFKILNTDFSLLNEIVDSYFTIKHMDIYLSTTFINNYFEIFRTDVNNCGMCDNYIMFNKKDFDYKTLKTILQKL